LRELFLAELSVERFTGIVRRLLQQALQGQRWAVELTLAYGLGKPAMVVEFDDDSEVRILRMPVPGPSLAESARDVAPGPTISGAPAPRAAQSENSARAGGEAPGRPDSGKDGQA
jgi:hypothetical protein